MNPDYGAHYLADMLDTLRKQKRLAERALEQLTDADLAYTLRDDADSNSIGVLMQHMAGNMRSRWTDFLSSDGEKPWRERDREFEPSPAMTKAALLEDWERGWRCLFDALEPLQPTDLGRTVLIRGEPMSVVQAINRQLAHYANHVGQIVMLAKHVRARDWVNLSMAKKDSKNVST